MNPIARTVLVTGAGSGLGRGISLVLAQSAHHILVTDLNLDRARETVAQIEAAGGRAQAYALDVTSETQIREFAYNLGETPIEILVNNAGVQHIESVQEYPVEKWDLLMNVLLRGTFLLSQAVLPGMRVRRFGRFIHIGSIHSLVASPYKPAYTAAKHALIGFSKVLALETANTDITSNVICPAYIRTPLVDAQIAAQARTRGISEEDVIEYVMLAPMPKKAFITVEEIAGTIEYLISPAARNVTGQAIAIDGGWTAQ